MEPLVFRFPLTAKTRVYLEITGPVPTRTELQKMYSLLETLVGGLNGGGPEIHPFTVALPLTGPVEMLDKLPAEPEGERRPRKLKDLGDCPVHHENNRHPRTNRCLKCMDEHIQRIRANKQSGTKVRTPANIERAHVVPRMVWSEVQRTCIVCGDRAVRYHRSERADPKDYWVHDKPSGVKPCLLQINKHDFIIEDLEYVPED